MKIYKQKFIEGKEDNLPKEAGFYFIGYSRVEIIDSLRYNPNEDITKAFCHYKESSEYWLEFIDWYFQPVEIPSEEEIEAEANTTYYRGWQIPGFIQGAKWVIKKLLK
jgi:hypothetical protein